MKGQIQIFTASLQRQLSEIAGDVREATVATHRDCLGSSPRETAPPRRKPRSSTWRAWRGWLLVNRSEEGR